MRTKAKVPYLWLYLTTCSLGASAGAVALAKDLQQLSITPSKHHSKHQKTLDQRLPSKGSSAMQLTQEEKDIANKLDFDEKILLILKKELGATFGIAKSGGLEAADLSFIQPDNFGPRPILPKDKDNYHAIAKQYPELEPLVKEILQTYEPIRNPITDNEELKQRRIKQIGQASYEREVKLWQALKPYMPLFRQLSNDRMPEKHRDRAVMFLETPQEVLDSDEGLQKAINDALETIKGQTLRKENQGTYQLAIKFNKMCNLLGPPDALFLKVSNQLEELGYNLSEKQAIHEEKVFETKEEVNEFLSSHGTPTNDKLYLWTQPADKKEVTYPEDNSSTSPKPLDMSEMFVKVRRAMPPGAKVTKVKDRTWLIESPARYTARALTRVALITKRDPDSNGIELVKNQHTNGSGLSNEEIIKKLTDWHTAYGITVIDATRNSLKIKFTRLPDDLDALCMDCTLIGMSPISSDDEHENASEMRKFAKRLQNTRELFLQFD